MPHALFLSGCNGQMGRVIRALLAQSPTDFTIVAGSDVRPDPQSPFPIVSDPEAFQGSFDVIVDFSNPAALAALCRLALRERKPMVICTTGLDQQARDLLAEAARTVPVFLSANMSLGINVLIQLAQKATRLLYPDFDLEIIEAHHNQKIDAPSGTALMIADALETSIDQPMTRVTDRSQKRDKRQPSEIGMHAIRGGSIVGWHTVLLAGPEEVLSIRHEAQSRAVFARGALAAARFLLTQKPGLYDMDDLLQA